MKTPLSRTFSGNLPETNVQKVLYAVADPRGGAESAAAPPPLFRPIFFFGADFCYFRARHRGIWIPGPPFSQILDPPLVRPFPKKWEHAWDPLPCIRVGAGETRSSFCITVNMILSITLFIVTIPWQGQWCIEDLSNVLFWVRADTNTLFNNTFHACNTNRQRPNSGSIPSTRCRLRIGAGRGWGFTLPSSHDKKSNKPSQWLHKILCAEKLCIPLHDKLQAQRRRGYRRGCAGGGGAPGTKPLPRKSHQI